jgi:hypothetical protein
MKLYRKTFAACSALLLAGVSAFAQTATCTTAPLTLSNLSIERVLTLNNLLTTLTPNVPASVLAAIAGGAVEIRERLIFDPQFNTLTSTIFTVAPGSPATTPLTTNIVGSTLSFDTISINSIFTSCSPTPSVLIVGTITSAFARGPFGNFTGAPAAVSIGYTTANPPVINNIAEVVAGQVLAFSATATGTISFPATPVTPPGSNAGNPNIVISPTPPTTGSFQVFQDNFVLNVSGSTDPNGLPLTFSFSSSRPALFLPSNNSPTPTIQFQGGAGDYVITVTATDSAGAKSTSTFTITFLGNANK